MCILSGEREGAGRAKGKASARKEDLVNLSICIATVFLRSFKYLSKNCFLQLGFGRQCQDVRRGQCLCEDTRRDTDGADSIYIQRVQEH